LPPSSAPDELGSIRAAADDEHAQQRQRILELEEQEARSRQRAEDLKGLLEEATAEIRLDDHDSAGRTAMDIAIALTKARVVGQRTARVRRGCSAAPYTMRIKRVATHKCDLAARPGCSYNQTGFWTRCPPCFGTRLVTTADDVVRSRIDDNQAASATELLRPTLLPRTDWPFEPFDSCAVVGYGHSLAGHGCGEEIDAHQAVFRTNCLPAFGDSPKDVGSRRDVELWNIGTFNSLLANKVWCSLGVDKHQTPSGGLDRNHRTVGIRPFAVHRARVAFLADANATEYLRLLRSSRARRLSSQIPMLQLHHTNASDWKADVAKAWFGQLGVPGAPSSGWAAIMLALGLCKEVALYGYNQPPSAGGVWAYEGHAMEAEHAVWRALAAAGAPVEVHVQHGSRWGGGAG